MKKIFIPTFKKFKKMAAFLACSIVLASLPVSATTTGEIQENIDEAQSDLDDASENKDQAEAELIAIQNRLATLESEVETLDKEVQALQSQITSLEEEAEELNAQIEETRVALAQAQVAEDNQYASMSNRIQYLYENGEVEYLDTLMSSSSFTDMLNKSEYIEQLSNYDQGEMDNLIAIREEIEEYESSLKADLRQVEAVQSDLEVQKAELEVVAAEKEDLIASYQEDEQLQQAIVNKYVSEMEAAEALITKYQEELAAQQAAEALAADGTVYYNVSGTYVWPVPSSYTISSGFGLREAPTVGASTNHKGIDIPVVTGSDIIASAGGTVVIAQYSPSAGYYIMIDHGNGTCTAYMHNSQLLVNVGETVSQGQVIAKSGNTGVSTGPHCHFALIINGSYVNPVLYLSR